MNAVTKKGRGRPKNSVCFTNIKLSELIERFGADSVIPVGRLWLNAQNKPTIITTTQVATQPATVNAEEKIEFSLVD